MRQDGSEARCPAPRIVSAACRTIAVRLSRQPLRGFLRMTFFLMPYTNSRHPEERPAGARLEGRTAPMQPSPPIGLTRIFAAFLWLGCTAFGGGTAGWLYREMVLRRHWIDDPAFLAMFSLGQAMPGSNGIKLTVLIGQRLHGAAGAVVALSGLLMAPFAIIVTIGALYAGFGEQRGLHAMLDGVAAVVVGLTFATGLHGLAQS